MRTLSALLLVLISTQAWSVSVYNCDVTAVNKNTSLKLSKKLLLSQEFSNQISFESTVVDLRVTGTEGLEGYVNGQRNFMISGTTKKGNFESAGHIGTIACAPAIETPSLFRFNPWNQYFSTDKLISQGHLLNSLEVGQIQYDLVCFLGDVNAAAEMASKSLSLKGVVNSPEEILFSFEVQECVRGWGSQDDYHCEEVRTVKYNKILQSCFSSENDHP